MKVAFYKKTSSLYDLGIQIVTHGIYCHCELVFNDPYFENGLWFSSRGSDNGTRFITVIPSASDWDFVNLNVTVEQEQKIKDFCKSELGCPYDWFGAARFVLPFLKPSKNAWFCSEVCIAGLQQIGMLSGDKDYLFSPNGFYKVLAGKNIL